MTCQHLQQSLSAWHDGELPLEEEKLLQAHLDQCPSCQASAQEHRALDSRIRSALAHDQVTARRIAGRVSQLVHPSSVSRRRSQVWRTGLVAALAAAAGFLLAWLLLPRQGFAPAPGAPPEIAQPVRQPDAAIQLTIATGAVEVMRNGAWSSMPTGGFVACGQPVRTPPLGRCEFRTPDGSEVRLNHDTQIVFDAGRKVRLDKGRVWSTVAAAPEPFQVLSPSATITALGTRFDVGRQGDQMQLMVLEGKTKVESAGRSAQVDAGHRLDLDGKSIPRPEPMSDVDLLQATNWVQEILILKGRDDPEFVRRINDLYAGIGETKMSFLVEDEIRLLGDHCVVPLIRYIQSQRSAQHPDKRQKAARLIADLSQPASIGDMIALLTDRDPQVRGAIAAGLKRLTRLELDMPPQAWTQATIESCQKGQQNWQQWWNVNQFRCQPGPK